MFKKKTGWINLLSRAEKDEGERSMVGDFRKLYVTKGSVVSLFSQSFARGCLFYGSLLSDWLTPRADSNDCTSFGSLRVLRGQPSGRAPRCCPLTLMRCHLTSGCLKAP